MFLQKQKNKINKIYWDLFALNGFERNHREIQTFYSSRDRFERGIEPPCFFFFEMPELGLKITAAQQLCTDLNEKNKIQRNFSDLLAGSRFTQIELLKNAGKRVHGCHASSAFILVTPNDSKCRQVFAVMGARTVACNDRRCHFGLKNS